MQNYKNQNIDDLFSAIKNLNSVEECYALFEDLCTIKEIQDMAQRFYTARLLDKGENYQTISEKAGISSATISRVNHCLNYGSGGYKTAIERLNKEKK